MTDRALLVTAVDDAFDAAGLISEHLVTLEDFAADLSDDEFSQRVFAMRDAIGAVGNRLARLRSEGSVNDPTPAEIPPGIRAAGAR